ncbi:MAG TPA: hypothetical protein VNU97_12470 [Rhizomicrobium sp.]|jgi:hypothetical protein|nr:hypothetical protein [Rhizomicrobium sp.]
MKSIRYFVLALLFAPLPLAAAAEDCGTAGSTAAKPLSFAVTDANSGQALSMTIIVGMTREMKNHHLGLKVDDPRCAAASVSIGTLRFVVRADDMSAWPRTAGENFEAILATTLRPAAASRLVSGFVVSRTAGAPSLTRVDPADVVYMLAGRTADRHVWSIYGFYDAIPDTPRLARMMCQAAVGSLPAAAQFETETQGVTFADVSALSSFADRGGTPGPCSVGPPP